MIMSYFNFYYPIFAVIGEPPVSEWELFGGPVRKAFKRYMKLKGKRRLKRCYLR